MIMFEIYLYDNELIMEQNLVLYLLELENFISYGSEGILAFFSSITLVIINNGGINFLLKSFEEKYII